MVSTWSSAPKLKMADGRGRRLLTAALVAVGMITGPLLISSTAQAANIQTATFSPAIAKSGTTLTLTVTYSNDIDCIKVVNSFGTKTSTADPAIFTYTAGVGDGIQTSTITGFKKGTSCANATASGQATFVLDNTAPTISGVPSPAANAAGWNNTSVAVNFTCADANGVASCGPNATLNTEGANLSASGTAVDNAGNSASTAVTGIKIDKTAPTLTANATPPPNGNGWYKSDVTMHWACDDNLSGVVSCPANSTVTGEGSSLTATATIVDKAGNSTTGSSPSVRIDRTAPLTTASAPPAWNNTNVTVTLNATDALSGVATTQYIVDGGSTQTGTSILFNTEGDHVLQYWSTDRAGNVETTRSVHVKIDKTSPTIAHTQSPVANGHGWNNTAVTVTFTCGDALSGIASCTSPQTVSTQSANQSVTGTATDNAGNTATDPAKVSIDTTAPSITAAADRAANANGWYAADVTVTFTCTDALSGVDTCSSAAVIGEGADRSANGTAVDAAGNTKTAGVLHINIDKTAPTLVGQPTAPPAQNGFYRGPVTIHWTCTDALSGFAAGACPADSVITGNGTGLSVGANVADRAGNVTVASSPAVAIDQIAPTTTSDAPSGWQDHNVDVHLQAGDQGPSGVHSTLFTVDGGAATPGTVVTVTEGHHVITFWSVDEAGNTEVAHTVDVDVDTTNPGISHTQVPAPNAHGWNNAPVTVSFTCTDQPALSGLASCVPPTHLFSSDGAAQTVTGTATDGAGNTAVDTATVSIDQLAPTITAAAQTSPNANGWYHAPVSVTFSCQDQPGLSGVSDCASPHVLGEGADQTATGSATDFAGNSASATVQHINVDMTNPDLSAAATSAPNANGWYRSDVTFVWSCGDGPSGIDGECPAPTTITGEGEHLSVGASVTDLAGNTTSTTTPEVSIDRHAPSTSADAPTQWTNHATTVTLDASDSLSGVEHTYFILDGAAGVIGTSVTIDTEGTHALEYWSVDAAGNEESHHTATVEIDSTAPSISASQEPPANANGWNNSDVTVTFTCTDQDGLSGIKSCTSPVAVTAEGLSHQVVGNAEDNAGNTASTTHTVNLDKTAPTITSTVSDTPNAAGWYDNPITVSFDCADSLSGVDECAEPATLVEGADQHATGTALDAAGNMASTTVADIDIDTTAPSIHGSVPAANAAGWYHADVVVDWSCDDSLSGVASCPDQSTITGEGVALSASGEAVDNAGNTSPGIVTGIHIDRTAPITLWSAPAGWSNTDVTVHAVPDDNLSGVAHTYIDVDGTTTADADVTIGEGVHTVRFWSVDVASNVEPANVVTISVDKTAPTISHTQTPAPNGAGWNNSDVTVAFDCADGLSGIASCTGPTTVDTETAGTAVFGTAVDHAGNEATDDVTVKLDKTPPTITATADRAANGHGWYDADVTVGFTCSDDLSNIADCPQAKQLAEGAGQSAHGTGHDVAGNATSAGVDGINIDSTAPSLSGAPVLPPNAAGWYNTDVDIDWTCADALSGLDGDCTANSTIDGEGTALIATTSVSDLAGNATTANSAPPVRIDRTAPLTTAAAPAGWVNGAVTVELTATDGLSGVAGTHYSLDGAPAGTGDSVEIATEGDHILAFWSIDAAGNEESHKTVSVRIDLTKPTIGHTQAPAANSHGWNLGDVEVTFTCADTGGSGLASCTSPQTVTGEGAGLSAHGIATDSAGNTADDTALVSIDRTAPTIVEAPGRPAPNANGWYNAPISVAFSCSDALSGIATCSSPVTIGEGAAQNVAGEATDNAGNGASTTVTGLNLDTHAPVISGAPPTAPNGAGWYRNDVAIHWTCSDTLSGIAASCPADTIVTGEGSALSATASVTDRAGNSASATVAGIHIDRTAPVTADDATSGWHQAVTTVHFSGNDNLSGLAVTYYTVDGGAPAIGNSVSVGEGNHTVSYWSKDQAGNVEAAHSVSVQVDLTAPTITGSATPAPNANGWNRGPITVHFTCADQAALSGIASCPVDSTLTGDGASQSVSGTAIDRAGNQKTITVGGLNIDTTPPSISFQGVVDGGTYTLGAAPTPSCTASDALSGVAQPCNGSVTGGNANGVGQFTYSATVTDRAGNSTTRSISYHVGYRFDGFLQPINDTAHQVGTSTSIFKAGSTVPVKFQLRRADGTVVQSVGAPQWLVPSRGASAAAAVDESLYAVASTNGTTYRVDGTQYIYNWGTDKANAGYYWRIGVRLDDGSTYYVNIGLR